ncbi:hypothetical protein QUA35_15125 [Microcoleus sp. N9_B2]|uniref:hypothetical protein n=1 Tax=unclassified Microcoleus TaxID=2642155 RepID=UPI002FD10D59
MNRELLRLRSARSLASFLLNLSQRLSPPIPQGRSHILKHTLKSSESFKRVSN